jgi:hypothetical protein
MKAKLNKKIKELYKSKASFCSENGHKYKDFGSKQRTLIKKIEWINEFLKPLNMKITVFEIEI